jgi:hypothetical protein
MTNLSRDEVNLLIWLLEIDFEEEGYNITKDEVEIQKKILEKMKIEKMKKATR